MAASFSGNEPMTNNGWMAAAVLAAAMALCGGCSDSAGTWDTLKGDFKPMPGNMLEDGKKLVTEPENALILLAGGGASGYVRCAHDDEIEDHFEGHHTFPRDFTIAQGAVGSPVSHFLLAGSAYTWSLLEQQERQRQVWRSMIEALSVNGLLTAGLKTIAQDHSPNGESLAWPSGHTSSSVTFATVLSEYYGPWVGIPLYTLCGFVVYERMETGEHWASDCVFGAALGYTVGKTAASRSKPEIFGMKILPFTDPQAGVSGIALVKSF